LEKHRNPVYEVYQQGLLRWLSGLFRSGHLLVTSGQISVTVSKRMFVSDWKHV
jgi:hypothetical protein